MILMIFTVWLVFVNDGCGLIDGWISTIFLSKKRAGRLQHHLEDYENKNYRHFNRLIAKCFFPFFIDRNFQLNVIKTP